MNGLLIEKAIDIAGKGLVSVGKSLVKHLSKHGAKYLAGGGAVAVGSAAYAAGHHNGKKEGTVQQAKRDEKKFQDLCDKHEKDRQKWKETDREKDMLINDLTEDTFGEKY